MRASVIRVSGLLEALLALSAALRECASESLGANARPLPTWFALVRKCVLDVAHAERPHAMQQRVAPRGSAIADIDSAVGDRLSVTAINLRCVRAFLAAGHSGRVESSWRTKGLSTLQMADLLERTALQWGQAFRGGDRRGTLEAESALLTLQLSLQHEARLVPGAASSKDAAPGTARMQRLEETFLGRTASGCEQSAGGAT